MKALIKLMNETQKMESLWWNDAEANRILAEAEKQGLIRRISVTQVEWTEKGAELASESNK